MAIAEAELIVFLIDAKEGVTSEDHHVADILRKSGKKIIMLASKCDSQKEEMSEILSFGFGEPIMLSATHNIGVEDLKDSIRKNIPKVKIEKKSGDENKIRLAILGRPNVGN